MQGAELYSLDYSQIFEMAQEDDFIFLDPPYDCVFNDYGNIDMMNGFDEAEHRRLAADFRNLPCRALMVIGITLSQKNSTENTSSMSITKTMQ